jgi:hypothetical protein
MGRNRVPTAKLEALGTFVRNPKRRRERANEPEPTGPAGDPPEHLGADERAVWNELTLQCPWAMNSDRLALEVVCVLVAEHRRGGGLPGSKLAPLVGLLARLGLTPSDRSRVTAPPRDPSLDDPAEAFFG